MFHRPHPSSSDESREDDCCTQKGLEIRTGAAEACTGKNRNTTGKYFFIISGS